MSERNTNIWIGLGVIAAVGLFAAWITSTDPAQSEGAYNLTAQFDQVDGVEIGTPVFLAGIQIGQVNGVVLNTKTLKPNLTLSITSRIRLPVDSAALIMSDGVLGGKFIKIDPGSEDEKMADGDAFEHRQSSIILEQVLERVVTTAEDRVRAQKKPAPGRPDDSIPQ